MDERRRFPRRPVEGEFARVPVSQQVRIIDISAGGVLIESARPLDVGTQGALRLNLAGAPFGADIIVRRVSNDYSGSGPFRIGAKFVTLSADNRQLIERFVIQ